MKPVRDIVSVKSFGDLVIALASLERLEPSRRANYRLLLGRHLLPLFEAMGSSIEVNILEHRESSVPSFYDVNLNGMRRAAISGWHLRRSLARVESCGFLFDRVGWRERLLAGGRTAISLPSQENIYQAYAVFLEAPTNPILICADAGLAAIAGIFPGSRLASKNLPASLIADCSRCLAERGLVPELFLLDGERPDLEHQFPSARILPRDFGAMKAAVESCDLVVSADSMPAHISEFAGKPVFVFSPVDNSYWLPLSSFEAGHWGLFDQGTGEAFRAFVRIFSKD